MQVLVIGSGGREHALCYKLRCSPLTETIWVTPGNPGILLEPKVQVVPGKPQGEALVQWALEQAIDLVVIGPEVELSQGLTDQLEAKKIKVLGPTQRAAELESSKVFAKQLMNIANIPTARFACFTSPVEAIKFVQSCDWPGLVVKADELAAGKGVVVCSSREEAQVAIENLLKNPDYTVKSQKIVIEERLYGRELSSFVLCDGQDYVVLGHACDYKQIYDGGLGPNTGGMGAYTPVDWMRPDLENKICQQVVVPTLRQMSKRGTPFKGILFIGLMIERPSGEQQPKVIEFNVRFGDPETQALLYHLDEDLLPWFMAAAKGELKSLGAHQVKHKAGACVHIVKAAQGYPGVEGKGVRKGDPIQLNDELLPQRSESNTSKLFFAGVAQQGHQYVTNGGRVMGLTSWGQTRLEAREAAYEEFSKVHFDGCQMRQDIGLEVEYVPQT